MAINEIRAGDRVLARHIPAAEAWGAGLKFFSGDGDYVQAGTWGYGAGKELLPHIHNTVPRTAQWTQEVIYVRKGSLRAFVYDRFESLVAEVDVGPGDLLVLLEGGHGYRILEDGTEVLEIKNGPYGGAEVDRRRFVGK
ncbi:MAG: hypothetical protein ABIQ86_02045 [Steroidobacteraceae bacterium]